MNVAYNTNQQDIAILVVSCDAYQDLWHPFFHCFFKYWPDCPYPVFLGSNTASYSDVRVNPILIGPDIDYSSNLMKMLDRIKQEWVILWIEDRVLRAPVDTANLARLIQLAQSRGAGYLKLIANHPFAWAADKTQEIAEIPKGSRYRVGITVALWHKPVLLQLLCPGETAWELERIGSGRSSNLDANFFCLTPQMRYTPPLSDIHLIVKGRLVRDARQFMKDENLLEGLGQRKWQTIRSFWYGRLYLFITDTYSAFKWQWQNLYNSK